MKSINYQLKKAIALLILLTLLVSVFILCFQTNDIVKAEISSNLTQDEMDIALGNLYCKKVFMNKLYSAGNCYLEVY